MDFEIYSVLRRLVIEAREHSGASVHRAKRATRALLINGLGQGDSGGLMNEMTINGKQQRHQRNATRTQRKGKRMFAHAKANVRASRQTHAAAVSSKEFRRLLQHSIGRLFRPVSRLSTFSLARRYECVAETERSTTGTHSFSAHVAARQPHCIHIASHRIQREASGEKVHADHVQPDPNMVERMRTSGAPGTTEHQWRYQIYFGEN